MHTTCHSTIYDSNYKCDMIAITNATMKNICIPRRQLLMPDSGLSGGFPVFISSNTDIDIRYP